MFTLNRECAKLALGDMLKFLLEDGGQAAVSPSPSLPSLFTPTFTCVSSPVSWRGVVWCGVVQVYDATNSTRERRELILEHCIPSGIKVHT